MKKTLGVWLSVLLAIGMGLYFLWIAYDFEESRAIIYSLPYFIAGIGLLRNKEWSQYIYYLLAIYGIGWWTYTIFTIRKSGWPYTTDWIDTIISLIPGMLFILLNIGIVIIVYKHFNSKINI